MGGKLAYVGILVEIFVSDLFTVVGLTGQKIALTNSKAHLANDSSDSVNDSHDSSGDHHVVEISVIRNPRWIIAFCIFLFGQASEAISLSFASETDVVSASNLTLLWNALFSVLIFKEPFTFFPKHREFSLRLFEEWDAFSMFLLVTGSIMVVCVVPQPDQDGINAEELMRKWISFPFCIYALILVLAIISCSILLRYNWRNQETGNLNAVLTATISAMISAITVTMSKAVMTLLRETISGENEFNNTTVVFVFLVWILSMVLSVGMLNIGLGNFEQGIIVPIYEVVGTLVTITSGILFYGTYKEFGPGIWAVSSVGVFMMCWGMSLVAHREVGERWLERSGYQSLSSSPNSSVTYQQEGGGNSSFFGNDFPESTVSSDSSYSVSDMSTNEINRMNI
mmetsp:Transcript_13195/g.15101  ORF Transcript_13195/g.15101 Transcript_13195/m.15101 type:complete len:397 (+) Transcript_13195:177-1367(+)